MAPSFAKSTTEGRPSLRFDPGLPNVGLATNSIPLGLGVFVEDLGEDFGEVGELVSAGALAANSHGAGSDAERAETAG